MRTGGADQARGEWRAWNDDGMPPSARQRPARRSPGAVVRVALERLGFGVAAAVTAALVLRWAGTPWRTCLLAASATLVVVPTAAWLAATVPGPPGTTAAAPVDERESTRSRRRSRARVVPGP